MNVTDIRNAILEGLNPTYKAKFKLEPSKNCYNISSLTHGAKAFLFMRKRERTRELNRHLIRGSMIDTYMKSIFGGEADHKNFVTWTMPFIWRDDSLHNQIKLIGHYDILTNDTILEVKAPEFQDDGTTTFFTNGSMVRAIRQAGSYARIHTMTTNRYTHAAVLLVNEKQLIQGSPIEQIVPMVHILTPDEILDSWSAVKNTAYVVAKELNKE